MTSNFLCRRPVLTDIVARRAQRKAAAADGSSQCSVRPPTASSSSQADSTSPPPPRSAAPAIQPPVVERAGALGISGGQASARPIASVCEGPIAGPSRSQPLPVSLTLPVALSPLPGPGVELATPVASALSASIRPAAVDSVGFRPTTPFAPSPDWSNLDFLASFPEFEALLASQGFAADSLSAPVTPLPEEIERDAHFEGALVLRSVGVEKGVAEVYNVSWNAQFCKYLPTEVVQEVLRYWTEICGDVPLTKAASTMCALLYCHGQERFNQAQKDSIADMMRLYQRKTIALVSRTKVPFAHELLTFSDLYCQSIAPHCRSRTASDTVAALQTSPLPKKGRRPPSYGTTGLRRQ